MPVRIIWVIFLLFYFFIPSQSVYAECDSIVELTVNPTTGTTADSFTANGRLQNCSNLSNAQSVRLFADNPNGDRKNPVSVPLSTDSSGNIIPVSVKFPNSGQWSFVVIANMRRLAPSYPVTVQVNQGRPLQCGEECPPQSSACPTDCACLAVGDKWYCGGTSTVVNPNLNPRCVSNLDLTKLEKCSYSQQDSVIRCGADKKGYVCQNPSARFCLKDGVVKEENVMCDVPKCPGPNCSAASGISCDPKSGNSPGDGGIMTAIGCVPTEPTELVKGLLGFSARAGGGVALLLIIYGVFQMITSAGNPDAVKKGGEQITSAVIGLLFILFSALLLKVIGVDILQIPGFS